MRHPVLLALVVGAVACSSAPEDDAAPPAAPAVSADGESASDAEPAMDESPMSAASGATDGDGDGGAAGARPLGPAATSYKNPVLPSGCADPGVLRDDDGTYVLSCTSGGAAAAFPLFVSRDLITWQRKGSIFPAGTKPAWSTGKSFWAPEVHKVGTHYVAYYSAEAKNGLKAVGAASAPTATGPFTDLGKPLVTDATIGVIDASAITTSKGESYLLWKIAGLGVGKPTPILSQRLSADGLAVTGKVVTLITNDQPWEGKSTEGPFMVERSGMFYLFYSGGVFSNATYAVGVARAASPHEPMTKLSKPILTTNNAWVGPGHNAVVQTARGGTAIVYHAWEKSCVGEAGCARKLLVDEIVWSANGWPSVPKGATSATQPTF